MILIECFPSDVSRFPVMAAVIDTPAFQSAINTAYAMAPTIGNLEVESPVPLVNWLFDAAEGPVSQEEGEVYSQKIQVQGEHIRIVAQNKHETTDWFETFDFTRAQIEAALHIVAQYPPSEGRAIITNLAVVDLHPDAGETRADHCRDIELVGYRPTTSPEEDATNEPSLS